MKIIKQDDVRDIAHRTVHGDLVIVGGGLAGVCAAITAAREGLKVILVQDRPVLGGNASSEVQLWALGATSHMGNNNRWAREGGVVNEILVENTYRNPEGNPYLFDAVVLDKVVSEPNISLLLNTAVFNVTLQDKVTIATVEAYNPQNETKYTIAAPLFCDASGDGIVGHLAGATYRVGAEATTDFGERFASPVEYGELLGHSIFMHTRDTGKPVKFVPPSFAMQDVPGRIPRFKQIAANDTGCQFWWLEFGGRMDTIHDTEEIKWQIWKVVYGVWDYIKNSGQFPDALNLTIDWVGNITGKRESRRFEGDTWITQQDLVEQNHHDDAVSFGGWAMDLHPADGVFSPLPGCTQWHSKGVYQIPYRAMYSKNISNLFLAGRIISASHVAFGSTRVMTTCGHSAQAVGMAAAMCTRDHTLPRDVLKKIKELQMRLMGIGQNIPGLALADRDDLARQAVVTSSSALLLRELADNGEVIPLSSAWAMIMPAKAGRLPQISFLLDSAHDTTIEFHVRTSQKDGNFTPDKILATKKISLTKGTNRWVDVDFNLHVDKPRYLFICVMPCDGVGAHLSDQRVTGILSVMHGANKKVAKGAIQTPPEGIGVESFEFWIPERRPKGKNLAIRIESGLDCFEPSSVVNGLSRPVMQPNAWVAELHEPKPSLTLTWDAPQKISRIELSFDTDWDHAMESVQWGHHDAAMPFCVDCYRVLDDNNALIFECNENHQTRNTIRINESVVTKQLKLEIVKTHGTPASIFEVRCYE
jgi:hypothetical protein